MKVQNLCHKHGISDAAYHNWKSKYGGREASDLKTDRELGMENTKLNRMNEELALENAAVKDCIKKRL